MVTERRVDGNRLRPWSAPELRRLPGRNGVDNSMNLGNDESNSELPS